MDTYHPHVPPSRRPPNYLFPDTCQLLCCLWLTAGSSFNFAVKLQLGAPLEAAWNGHWNRIKVLSHWGRNLIGSTLIVSLCHSRLKSGQIPRHLTEFFWEIWDVTCFVTGGHQINKFSHSVDLQVRRRPLDSTATRPPPTFFGYCNSTEITF